MYHLGYGCFYFCLHIFPIYVLHIKHTIFYLYYVIPYEKLNKMLLVLGTLIKLIFQ